jgi:hypothetical protein
MLTGNVWALVLIGAIGIRAWTSVSLYRAAVDAGLARHTAITVAVGAAALLLAWVAVAALLASDGVFRSGPWGAVFTVGTALAVLACVRIPVVKRVLSAPGIIVHLAWPQTVRLIGVVFLILLFAGKATPLAALPAGLGDMAVGIATPWVARSLARGASQRRAFWFNVLGIVDVAVTFVNRLVSGLVFGIPAGASGVLPLVLLSTTALPLAFAIHVVSLRRMAGAPGGAARQAGMTTAITGSSSLVKPKKSVSSMTMPSRRR